MQSMKSSAALFVLAGALCAPWPMAAAADAPSSAAPAGVTVAPPAPLDPARLALYRHVAQSVKLDQLFRVWLNKTPNDGSERSQLFAHMRQHDIADGIYTAAAPYLARQISPASATRIISFFDSATGRKASAALYARLATPAAPSVPLTPAEQLEYAAFNNSPAGRELGASASQDKLNPIFTTWGNGYTLQLVHRQMNEARVYIAAMAAAAPGAAGPAKLLPSGITSIDMVVDHMVRSSLKMTRAAKAFDADLQSYGIADALRGERLVSQEGIDQSRHAVDQADLRVEQYGRQLDELLQERSAGFRSIPGATVADVQDADKSAARAFDWSVRFGENQRTILDCYRRTLALAESRLGTLHMEQGKLVFANDADLRLYQSLKTQMDQALAVATALDAERSGKPPVADKAAAPPVAAKL